MYGDYGSSLRDLPRLRNSKRRRASSWDRSGGNDDRLTIRPGETAVLADLEGPGSINHIWCTVARDSPWGPDEMDGDYLRKLILKITWEDSSEPSVLVPLGDFFGVGHGRTVNFVSAPLQMSPQDGKGFNCWFHMPFAGRARVELISELTAAPVFFYYYIDYELFDGVQDGLGYFHASYNRQNPTDGVDQGDETLRQYQVEGTNLDGAGNYVVLDTEGKGALRRVRRQHPQPARLGRLELVRRGRRHDLHRRRTVPAVTARHRHRGLLQHRLVPERGVLGAVPRHHPARWAELERRDLAVPLPHRGSDHVLRVHPRDHRARAREQAQ
ncbi:hypothetical protein GCM10009743_55340 [Kribbella swartbergensis]